MALFQGDVVIKTAIQLAVEDIKKNSWLIEDIFSDFIENPILKQKYGMKEIERAKEFILNNKISYYMNLRMDNEEFPCVTVRMGDSQEDESLATLGDNTICVEDLDPEDIKETIAFIVKPFQIINYDPTTGTIEIEENIDGFEYVGEGMIAVDPETGNGFTISEKLDNKSFRISAGSDLNVDKLAIVPKYQKFRARREGITSQETYNIGCHAHGDPSTLIFLFCLVKYAVLRYREGLFEYNNFQLSTISCSDMIKNTAFQADNVYSRFITIKGQAQEDWIKTPYRIWEAVDIADCVDNMKAGIKICSNENTVEGTPEADNDLWETIDQDEE